MAAGTKKMVFWDATSHT